LVLDAAVVDGTGLAADSGDGRGAGVGLDGTSVGEPRATGYLWAFSTLTASPGARAHYDRRRAAGDRHAAAQRNLFNRLIGCLPHCISTGVLYSEAVAFHQPQTLAA
jgi:hypothetical protein